MKTKNKIEDPGLYVWSKIVYFDCQKGQWREKIWVTNKNESDANDLIDLYIKNKQDKFPMELDYKIESDLIPDEKNPRTLKPSVHGQITWMSEMKELQKLDLKGVEE